MWDIIVWKDENAIDYVPSSWANPNKTAYKYPLSSETKIRSLIYDCQELHEKFKWYEAILKRGNIKSLEKAKELCEKGKFTSSLETSDNEDVIQSSSNKRKRKLTKKILEQMNDSQVTDEYSSDVDSEEDINHHQFVFKVPSVTPTNTSQTQPAVAFSVNTAKDTAVETEKRDSRNNSSDSSGSLCSNYSGSTLPENYVTLLLKNQAEIRYELKCITKKIDKLEHLQYLKEGNIPHQESSAVLINKMPCSNLQELEELEQVISDDAKLNELVNILFLVGGENVHKTIYAMLKRLLSNDLALKFSGQGKKRKKPFCQLNIHKALTYATRKRHASASDDQIRKNVSLYLAQTKARINASQSKQIQNINDEN